MKATVYSKTGSPDAPRHEDVADPPRHASGVTGQLGALAAARGF